MSLATKAALIGALAGAVAAHGTVTGFTTDGKYNGGFQLEYYYLEDQNQPVPDTAGWYAENLDNGFIDGTGYQSADIICHKAGRPATSTATVAAGGTVDFHWSVWPDSHIGPVITYVARCAGDCADADKTALEWVKIDEAGYDAATKTWVTTTMIANNNTHSVTVPASLAAGNYVFRHEIIALHGAEAANGAQNYPQCMNIAITGGGSDEPAGVLGTELYTSTDAGILFSPYSGFSEYPIPGPALYSGASSGGGGSSPAPTTTKAAATSAAATSAAVPAETSAATPPPTEDDEEEEGDDEDCTGEDDDEEEGDDEGDDGEDCTGEDDEEEDDETPAPVPTTAAPTTLVTSARPSSTAGAGTVAIYGQCGGKTYSGTTACASGSTCKAQNDYYSQCVPSQ
jgi:hypothetical protein